MSALAALYNVPSTTPELETWGFAHMAHHRDIIRIIYQQTGFRLTEFPLDPFNPSNAEAWSYQHQQMHNEMDTVLGISGYNLLDPIFDEPSARAAWIFLNSDEHRQAADILQLG